MKKPEADKMIELLRKHMPAARQDLPIDSTSIINDLELDSLALLEWVYEMEQLFGCELNDPQMELLNHVKTVDDVAVLFSSVLGTPTVLSDQLNNV